MLRYIILTAVSTICSFSIHAQSHDTLRVMAYNLLNYRNVTQYCTAINNDPVAKETNLKIVHWYYQPHILICNEIGASPTSNYSFILDNVLNTGGHSSYKAANFSNNAFSSLVNMLYYDSDKVELYDQDAVSVDLNGSSLVRVIDIYTLFYKDPNLAIHQDTVFITAIAAHLKAGGSGGDEIDRAKATAALMDYLKNNEIRGNVFIGGDFNISSSNAASYQNLVNETDPSYRFHDPVNKPGNWSGSSTFAAIHTQSTHSSGGCPSGGGLDDRFDFLLVQFPMTVSANSVTYIPNTYKAFGNPGNAYNQALPTTNNGSVPDPVANALYNVSDHLPVVMELEVEQKPTGISKPTPIELTHPTVVNRELPVYWKSHGSEIPVEISVLNLFGQKVLNQSINGQSGNTVLDLGQLTNGLYFLTVTGSEGSQLTRQILKF